MSKLEDNRFFCLSIRGALLLLLLTVLIPMLLVQGIIYYKWFGTRLTEEVRANQELARAMSTSITELMRDVRNQELSIGRAITSLKAGSPAEVNQWLSRTEKEDPSVQFLAWTDARGKVLASSDPSVLHHDLAAQSYVREVLRGKPWAVSNLVPARRGGNLTFVVSRGIRDPKNTLQGVMLAEIEMTRMATVIASVERSKEGMITFFDRNGVLVYSHPANQLNAADRKALSQDPLLRRALAGKEVYGTTKLSPRGKPWIAAWTPIGDTGWVAGAGRPMMTAMGPVIRSLLNVVGLTLAVVVLSVQTARSISRTVTMPTENLRRYAMSLGQDESVAWIAPTPRITELRELAATFDRMADQLHERKEALQRANEELELRVRERTAELQRSNADLERFAYVASHDLQEPLRMVAGYVGWLAREYQDKLDANAREFIQYAIDGSVRMQRLIRDLLEFSRVGRTEKAFARVNVQTLLTQVLDNLKVRIEETGAVVTSDPLPEVLADEIQLMQVFQNLIDNAIKFHGPQPPQIHLGVEDRASEWLFTVRDNGIGIDPVYFKRLFVLFQRLHTRRHYPGNGIGLALCKRIIEYHGGHIWVRSAPGQGTTFYFTLPARLNVSVIEPRPSSLVRSASEK